MKRTLRLTVLAGIVLFLGTECGLESYPSLNPPTVGLPPPSSTSPVFRIQATALNSEFEFRGFELYYKLYSISEQTEINITKWDDLRTRFKRVHSADERLGQESRPLIDIPLGNRGEELPIEIHFSFLNTEEPFASYLTITKELRRGIVYPATLDPFQHYMRFSGVSISDEDISQAVRNDIQNGITRVVLVLYGLSYGVKNAFDTTGFTSDAVYLGQIELSTDQLGIRKLPSGKST